MSKPTPYPQQWARRENDSIVIGVRAGDFRISYGEAQFLVEFLPKLMKHMPSGDYGIEGMKSTGSATYVL